MRVGVLVMAVLVVGCSGGPSADTTPVDPDRQFGHGSQWIDEPLPNLDEFLAVDQCDDLYRMYVGVHSERFRLKVDVTAEDDAENNYQHWDFDEYEVFSEIQADLNCSDAEFGEVIQNSQDARCHRWALDGHRPDEEPLMLNTAQCFDVTG